jgi:hypothetical protein
MVRNKLPVLQIAVLVTAVLCMLAGYLSGDTAAIFRKAVFICMECIGIA